MGVELVQRMDSGMVKLEWDGERQATPLGNQTYEMGLDEADQFVGDLQVFNRALKIFRSGDSRPYALAGAAYLLLIAAREADGSYTLEALDHVQPWLEKAQEDEPDRPEINFIEARLYIFRGEMDNARIVLDYLMAQAPYYYHLNVTEALYWEGLGDIDKMASWFGAASKYADNVPKQVRLYEKMGDAFVAHDRLEEALEQYRHAVHFNEQSGRLWHKQSLIFWELDRLEECKTANTQAIKFGLGEEAEEMQNALRRRLGTNTLLRRMLGGE